MVGKNLPSWELTYPPKNSILKMIFLFPRWDMLIPWRVDLGGLFFRFKVYGSVALLKSAKPTLRKTRPLTA